MIEKIQTAIQKHPGLAFAMLPICCIIADSIVMWGVK